MWKWIKNESERLSQGKRILVLSCSFNFICIHVFSFFLHSFPLNTLSLKLMLIREMIIKNLCMLKEAYWKGTKPKWMNERRTICSRPPLTTAVNAQSGLTMCLTNSRDNTSLMPCVYIKNWWCLEWVILLCLLNEVTVGPTFLPSQIWIKQIKSHK